MFLFACYTGLRISDVLLLKWENIVDDKVYFQIKKTESILSIKLVDKAKEILQIYAKENIDKKAFIFHPFKNKEIDLDNEYILGKSISSASAYVNKSLDDISKLLNMKKKMNFHISRHTFATLLLKNKVPVQYVQRLLGHTKLQTTMIYAHIVDQDLEEQMDKYNAVLS